MTRNPRSQYIPEVLESPEEDENPPPTIEELEAEYLEAGAPLCPSCGHAIGGPLCLCGCELL